MRWILERAGYEYREESEDWRGPNGETVADEDVEAHHSREAAKLVLNKLKQYV
jgi:hypothetical protein